ncbi:hypothetical protein JCM11641_003658 [Rhodosporidiobolus odoratus]
MAKGSHPPFTQMLDYAIHSGHGEKVSRKKISTCIEERWTVDSGTDYYKDGMKTAIAKRKEQGLVEQDKQSFLFTAEGEQFYDENYAASDEEDEPKAAGSKKK